MSDWQPPRRKVAKDAPKGAGLICPWCNQNSGLHIPEWGPDDDRELFDLRCAACHKPVDAEHDFVWTDDEGEIAWWTLEKPEVPRP